MARRTRYGSPKSRGRTKVKRRRSKYTEQEKFAYKLGQAMRGLENPDSRISESYNNGKKPKTVKARKPLY